MAMRDAKKSYGVKKAGVGVGGFVVGKSDGPFVTSECVAAWPSGWKPNRGLAPGV